MPVIPMQPFGSTSMYELPALRGSDRPFQPRAVGSPPIQTAEGGDNEFSAPRGVAAVSRQQGETSGAEDH